MIKKISARLQKTHLKYKTNKEQQLLNNFVTLHGNHVNRQAYNEIHKYFNYNGKITNSVILKLFRFYNDRRVKC